MDLELKGKVAIVTGASYGIGEGIARGMAAEGVKLAICARGEEKLEKVAGELKDVGAEVVAVAADVLKPDDIERVFQGAMDAFGGVDILVNNAGGMVRGNFSQTGDDDWRLGMDLNLNSIIRFCRLVIPGMQERRWGRIINISSVWGHQPGVSTVYNAAKAAVISLGKSLSNELALDNVLVNSVCPGGIVTPAWIEMAEILAKKRGTTWQEEIDKLAKKWTGMGRYGTVEEVADTVLFLASEKASYITGACINVDGGNTKSMI